MTTYLRSSSRGASLMDIKLFSDLIDALGKVGGGLKALTK
jgi:hypothetical protein